MSAFYSTGMPLAEGDPDKRDQNKCVQQLPYLNGTWASHGQASGKCHQISQMRLPWGRGRDSMQVECSLRGWVCVVPGQCSATQDRNGSATLQPTPPASLFEFLGPQSLGFPIIRGHSPSIGAELIFNGDTFDCARKCEPRPWQSPYDGTAATGMIRGRGSGESETPSMGVPLPPISIHCD